MRWGWRSLAATEQRLQGTAHGKQVRTGLAGSPFQQQVWTGLQAIPSGATRSYAELAAAIGRESAVRAVGRANGDNRLSIIVPCHRVIGADGSLTGYGGGLARKQKLLDLERGGGQANLFAGPTSVL